MRTWWSSTVTIAPSARARGRITVPGDKSISHRYAMLAALADGTSRIRGYSPGNDCQATLACLRALGVAVEQKPHLVTITGRGPILSAPSRPLDAANSGTTMRLMSGILAAQPFTSEFVGDDSLSRRPMRRIIGPLERMGAHIESTDGRPPLTIHGAALRGIRFAPEVPSAQVKSCLLLAGLFASGETIVDEPAATRDHTERALNTFGVPVVRDRAAVGVTGGHRLAARDLAVPGDLSSAAFWCVLAAATPGGDVMIDGVGLNDTRTGFLDVLKRAGADVSAELDPAAPGDEPVGCLRVRSRSCNSVTIEPDEVPGLIDEIPALAAFAAMMPPGRALSVRGARELRVKESDRISALAEGFREIGSDVEEFDDGFTLVSRPLRGAPSVRAAGDHRLAMAFMIAATRAAAPVTIHEVAVDVSYPGFHETLHLLTS